MAPGRVELVVGMLPCVGVTKPPFGAPTHMGNCWNPTLNVGRTVGVVVHRATVLTCYRALVVPTRILEHQRSRVIVGIHR